MSEWIKIKSVEEIEECSDVYDIEVEDTHNFYVNNILVHNCLAGLPTWLMLRDEGKTNLNASFDAELKPLLDIFGKDRAYLEIQFNKLPEQKRINDALIEYSKHSGHKLLATADSHYAKPEYWRDRELYRMLGWQKKHMQVSIDDLPKDKSELKCELYPKNGEEMYAEYLRMEGLDHSDESEKSYLVREAIGRGYDIAHDFCEYVNQSSEMKIPKIVGDKTAQEVLEEISWAGLKEKKKDTNPEYRARLELELNVIKKKNFADYFVNLHKAMSEIKKYQLSSPGRGSGCGSLILYVLDITQLDPIKNGLLFERFLSEYRSDPPDVDLDSDDKPRSLQILKNLFGETEVIPITNYNTWQLKSLVKSISKLYGIPFQDVNEVTKLIDDEARQDIIDEADGDQKLAKMTNENVLKHSETYQKFIAKYPEVGEHIDVLYNQIAAIGRHAGGIAITQCSEEAMPVIRVKGEDQTPWTEGLTAKHLEPAGIIKYDFLAIQTLGYIRRCIELVLRKKLKRGPTFEEINDFYKTNLHPDAVEDGDEDVFEHVYRAGKFPGIFQFTNNGAQKLCVNAKPSRIMDLAILTSIYRPGPLTGQVDKKYIDTVENPEDIRFDHPVLEEELGQTNGFIVFQEQFMFLAHRLADYTMEESNSLRKLLMKPLTSMGDEMKLQREEAGKKFIQGCIDNGMSEIRANRLWFEEILGFISYGFNKSHALAYSYVSYQCAWLYHHFPDEWVCAYLELSPKRDKAISDVESAGYVIGKPDILKSSGNWTAYGNELVPSFQTLKGIGEAAVEELVQVREGWDFPDSENFDETYFKSIFESFFYEFVKVQMKKSVKIKKKWKFSKFNKASLEALIKIEALDSLNLVGPGKLFENYAHMYRTLILNWSKKEQVKFDILDVAKETSSQDWNDHEKIVFQSKILGTYDKALMFTEGEIAMLEGADILPLDMVDDVPKSIWFIIDDWKMAKTSTKKKDYYKLFVSDLTGNKKVLNYFLPLRDPPVRLGIYGADLFMNGSWLNLAKGSFLVRIK